MNRLAMLVVLGACGSNSSVFDPGSGDDPGTGTNTLVVDGNVRARANARNAQTPAEFSTEFGVRVMLNGVLVTDGTVSITSASGSIELVLQSTGERAGRWVGTAPRYEQVYVMDVESGADRVVGVRVEGPDAHLFSAPLPGALVDSTMPLVVTWEREVEADTTTIRAENVDDVSVPDTGTYTLPAGALRAEDDETRENTLRITRTNRVVPAGAAGGSDVSVAIENDIDVTVLADPQQ